MRPRDYEKFRYQIRAHEMQEKKDKDSFLLNPISEQLNQRDRTLLLRVKELLDKYKNDEETRAKILDALSIFVVNLSVAETLKDKKAIVKRVREFHSLLDEF